ncbi:MAG TPA: HEAT repeat domain-containing protein [Thermoplasmata archaeon]|nr:HEAT repeat domain-containing protein [Thermoplasmata archaeon]
MIDASTKEALERSFLDLADAVSIGLGNATAAQFQTMATELRALGLEAPAEGADRLAACVGPEADPIDGLNAFARLEQMLDAVRVRLMTAPDVSGRLVLEVPTLPSLRVDAESLAPLAQASLWDYPAQADPVARYSYLVRVAQRLQRGPMAPAGDGLAVWSNLQAGALIVESLARNPHVAIDMVRQAYGNRNLVIRRNAVRVLAAISVPYAPLPSDDVRMRLLSKAMRSGVPILAHETLAIHRMAKGLPAYDPGEPYTGADASGEVGIGQRIKLIRDLGGKPKPTDPWFAHSRYLGETELRQLQGPKGEVQERLTRIVRFDKDRDRRRRAVMALMFLEDAMAIPCLRDALRDSALEVRKAALWGLGGLGDDSILPLCRRHLAGDSEMTEEAATALGALQDSRGFPILWSAYEANLAQHRTKESLGFLCEASVPLLTKVGLNPSIMSRAGTLRIFDYIWRDGAADAVLSVIEATADPRARSLLLKPLVLPDLEEPAKKIAIGVRDRILRRIADRSVPLATRVEYASHLKRIDPAGAERLLVPVLKALPKEEAAALGAAPRRGWPRRKRGGRPDAR